MSAQTDRDRNDPPMHRRRTTMFDGRYMYYYTFGDEAVEAAAREARGSASGEPTQDAAEDRDV